VHPYFQERELKDFLQKEGIVIQAWYPLGHGDKALLEETTFTKLAKKYGKTVIAFAGSVERDARECNEHGIDAFFPVLRGITTLEEAMKNENAKRNLADTAEQVYRLWR
jgi:glycerate kinase